jgi:hypothetical protein
MKIKTTYVNGRGHEFATLKDAIAHEDKLPHLIEITKNDLIGMQLKEDPGLAANIEFMNSALQNYEEQWKIIQKERLEESFQKDSDK